MRPHGQPPQQKNTHCVPEFMKKHVIEGARGIKSVIKKKKIKKALT